VTPSLSSMTASAATTSAGRSYTSSAHGVTIIEGFQRLWQDALMCDTQLLVQGQTFNVHRGFLAACSQYFYSMFTKDFQEKSQNQVKYYFNGRFTVSVLGVCWLGGGYIPSNAKVSPAPKWDMLHPYNG